MSEIIEKAIAKILYNILIKYFDDIESLTQIQTSQDFALIHKLDDMLPSEQNRRNCDYTLIVGAWNELYNAVKRLNKENEKFISYVLVEFDVSIKDDMLISGTLYNHEKLFTIKLPTSWADVYQKYILRLDDIICQFRIALLNYEIATVQDEFFDHCSMIRDENIKFQKSDVKSKSVYLDTNAIQELSRDHKTKNLINNSTTCFVYSSYLIEDALNSNPIFFSSFCSELHSITNGEMVGYMNERLCYVKEQINNTIARVQKYSKLTKLNERNRMVTFIQDYHIYPELRKGRELSQKISKNVIDFFKGENKMEVAGFKYVISKFSKTSIRKFVASGNIDVIEDYKAAVSDLSDLFDFVNFETEQIKFSNLRKIASSYRDRKHLEHAYICDYFVTADNKLKNRAEIIYKILGLKTKVINIKDLKSKLKNQNL